MYAFYSFFLPCCNRQKFRHSLCIELVRVDSFALFLTLRREHSFFYYVSYNFFTDFLFQAGNFAFYFYVAKKFCHDNCGNVSSDFSPLTEMIMCIFLFLFGLLAWWITLTFSMLSQPFIPRINLTWSWHILVLFISCWLKLLFKPSRGREDGAQWEI